eukprot:gb/GECG01016265.1/.p1 GENE.gb/GECG01016265.1/~~gb/GECG01016265.1/.p1  ORF type:complete len:125 (+),score=10.13 gb/GECG01016265.1/:1-375(+)
MCPASMVAVKAPTIHPGRRKISPHNTRLSISMNGCECRREMCDWLCHSLCATFSALPPRFLWFYLCPFCGSSKLDLADDSKQKAGPEACMPRNPNPVSLVEWLGRHCLFEAVLSPRRCNTAEGS